MSILSVSEALIEARDCMRHARKFIASREKMHPDGVFLFDVALGNADLALKQASAPDPLAAELARLTALNAGLTRDYNALLHTNAGLAAEIDAQVRVGQSLIEHGGSPAEMVALRQRLADADRIVAAVNASAALACEKEREAAMVHAEDADDARVENTRLREALASVGATAANIRTAHPDRGVGAAYGALEFIVETTRAALAPASASEDSNAVR